MIVEAAEKLTSEPATTNQIAQIKLATDAVEEDEFILRGRTQPATKGRTFAQFDEALACTDYLEQEPIIEWRGLDKTAALDVDHSSEPPEAFIQRQAVFRLPLVPNYWWRTHGGGLRLIYHALDPLSAHECAAIARLLLRREYSADKWEILPRTRHPHYPRGEQRCGTVYPAEARADGLERAKQILLGNTAWSDADSDKVEAWLEENGMQIGARYDHDHCPVDPSDHGKNKPVVVLDGGIHCHKCDRFTPFSRLINDEPIRVKNLLRAAVRNMTHWAHAQHIIDCEVAYRGLLKLWHLRGDDEAQDELVNKQIGKVFFSPIDMIRSSDRWLWSTDFSPVEQASLDLNLKQLPALQYIDEKGKVGTKPLALAKFLSAQDLTDLGYPNIEILRGVDIAAKARAFHDDGLYALRPADPPFRFRPAPERDITPLNRGYPGLRVDLLKLLIAAKGVLQAGGNPEIPRIFIHGQSGAAKSAHVRLAANLTGEREAECDCGDDRGKFIRGYADASLVSSFALFNEVAKKGLSDSELRGRFLGLERGLQYHAMYFGTARIRTPAVIVCTDVELPRIFQSDTQLARRFVVVDLGAGRNESGQEWYATCGSGSIQQWRNDPYSLGANADAADSLISEVIDEFFAREPAPTFAEIAKRLGFGRLSDASESDADSELREFYDAVMALPEETEGHFAKRGPGWRAWHTEYRSEVTKGVIALWNELTANGTDLQRLKGANWSKITGIPGMRFSEHKHRSWQGVRFAPDRRGGER